MENSPNTIVESRQEFMVSQTSHVNAEPFLRTAHFLKPSTTEPSSSLSLPSLPPKFDPKNWPLTVNFHGWRNPSQNWKQWVDKMASFHAPTWKKVGIFEAIINSTFEIHQNRDLILGLAERWCPDTNSFIFPWGEATVTLEDMLIAGYSVFGSPVFETLETEESKEVQKALVQERKKVTRNSAGRKARHQAWLKTFMDSGSDIEHEAFLSLWLSRFVFPNTLDLIRESVFPIAIHLARGTRIALAPAVLSSIYRDLSLLKEKIVSLATLDAANNEKVVVTTFAPFQLVLVWVWERFVKLSPKPKLIKIGEPRIAQWNLGCNVKYNINNVRLVLDSSEGYFNWRPYTKPLENWDFPKFYKDNEMWVQNSDLDDDLFPFILCLRVSELIGMEWNCRQQYLPHRVARQFGFDQDVPGFVAQSDGSSKDAAWSCYIRRVSDVKCFIPSRLFEKDVTTRYLDWLKALVTNGLRDKKKAVSSSNRGYKRADRVEGDSSYKDNLRIAKIPKQKLNQDIASNRQCANWNNLSGTPECVSSPIPTETCAASVKRMLKRNDDGNLTASRSCSAAANGIMRRPDQVALVEAAENGEDVDPENVRVELGECQSHSSSVGGNDQTPNDSAVKEATMTQNVTVNAKQDVEFANIYVTRSSVDNEKNKINGYSFEAAAMDLECRIERLEKINAETKALLCGRYSGTKRARGYCF